MITSCIALVLLSAGTEPAVKPRVPDQIALAAPRQVQLGGLLGLRYAANYNGRLTHVPMDELLGGFKQRPGSHPWIGEHIGKWMHAASLTWEATRSPELGLMLEAATRQLLDTQKPDGYLGTYEDKDRWTSWDVWVHKYNLIGLLAYHRATGNERALRGAARVGDLLVATFGPGKRDIIAAGTHVGMAATSVLEPMVELYRVTGDEKYLAFCRYLVESWDQPEGPKVLASLLEHGKVNRTANGKAYEMMSNLVGLCELYRVTGDARYLDACRKAWDDIAANQTFVTGGTSLREHFQPDGHLPETGAVAETCANVTWQQLCMHLLALTGEAKYADALEVLAYNHLIGAQAPDGNDWCYFTVLAGRKEFTQHVNCCHSSGPRGVALLPTLFYGRTEAGLRVLLYGESEYTTVLADGTKVSVKQETDYPASGEITLHVSPEKKSRFRLDLRVPAWSKTATVQVNGAEAEARPEAGWVSVERMWLGGDVVTLELDVAPRWVRGRGELGDRVAPMKGPLVLCFKPQQNDRLPPELLGVEQGAAFGSATNLPQQMEARLSVSAEGKLLTPTGLQDRRLTLTPFALVHKEEFLVWLRTTDALRRIK